MTDFHAFLEVACAASFSSRRVVFVYPARPLRHCSYFHLKDACVFEWPVQLPLVESVTPFLDSGARRRAYEETFPETLPSSLASRFSQRTTCFVAEEIVCSVNSFPVLNKVLYARPHRMSKITHSTKTYFFFHMKRYIDALRVWQYCEDRQSTPGTC